MKKISKIFAVVLCLVMVISMLPLAVSAANEKYVEFTVDSLGLASQSYTADKTTVDGVEVEWIQLGNYGDGIQVRDKNGNTSMFWNTSALPGAITKIELTYSATKDVTYSNPDSVIFNFGNAAQGADYSTKLSTTAGEKSYTITPNGDYTYFYMEHDLGYTMYWDSIKVYYKETSGGNSGNTGNTPSTPSTPAVTSGKIELTVDSLGLGSQSYSAGTATVNGAGIEWIQLGNYGDGIQMRDKNGNTSMVWNTTALPGAITKIELTYSATKDVTYANPDSVIFNFGNAAQGADYSTKLSTTAGEKSYTITPNGDYSYFYMEHDLGYTMYWDSIVIYYEVAGGSNPGTSDYSVAGLAFAMVAATAAVVVLAKKKEF